MYSTRRCMADYPRVDIEMCLLFSNRHLLITITQTPIEYLSQDGRTNNFLLSSSPHFTLNSKKSTKVQSFEAVPVFCFG